MGLSKKESVCPKYNIKMYLSLRFGKSVPDISISPGSYEVIFDDNTTIRFDFLDTIGNIDKNNSRVVDFELIELDYDTFPNAINLPAKLLKSKIKSISEVFVYVYVSNDDEDYTATAVKAMSFVVTDNTTGKETAIDVTDDVCRMATLEFDGD